MRLKPWEVPDGLWQRIEPLLPRRQRRFRYPGRRPLDDRKVLQGILFVLHTGIGWEHLPQELGFGCGMTAWQRGVKPIIARRQTDHGSGLGRHRWVVERTFACRHNRRRLLVRTDRRDDIHEGFLALAC
jgi:transposase